MGNNTLLDLLKFFWLPLEIFQCIIRRVLPKLALNVAIVRISVTMLAV